MLTRSRPDVALAKQPSPGGFAEKMSQEKQLTAVMAALDTYAEVRDALRWCHQQSARSRLEILVVCPKLSAFALPDNYEEEVGSLEIVECGEGKTLAEARAHGARLANTAYVIFLEDHSFLEPGWCERVLARFESGWTGVGGAFLSANPQTVLAQGQILVGYGQWLHPITPGEMAFVSGHGTAYRREVLMERSETLENDFLVEPLMMAELRKQGQRFFCESEVVSWHFDSSHWKGVGLTAVGRVLAAQRSICWPVWRRFAIGAAFPLIAVVRWKRASQAYFRTRRANGLSLFALPMAAVLCFIWSWNELLGFWFGFGNSRQALSDFEHNRKRHLHEGEWPVPRRPAGMTAEEFSRRIARLGAGPSR